MNGAPSLPYLLLWLGIAVQTAAPLFALSTLSSTSTPGRSWAYCLAILGFGLVAAGLAFRPPRRLRREAIVRALFIAVIVLNVVWIGYGLLEWLIVRQPRFPLLSYLASALIDLGRNASVSPEGDVLVRSHEGLLIFAPTFDKIGLVPFVPFMLAAAAMLALERRRSQGFMLLFGATLIFAAVRFAVNILRFVGFSNALASNPGGARTEIFQRPFESLAWLAALAVVVAVVRWRQTAGSESEPPPAAAPASSAPRPAHFALSFAAFACGLLLLTFMALHHPAGTPRKGRVLVDDTFCGVWEPAARRLTSDWYGDFSTYSFTSAVEWLGYYFATTVNCKEPYTDALLADYDVLILKTPSKPIPEAEREAILRFVERGGGLFAIGDHTNLMGMSVRLNQLTERAGIRFRFDSVMDARHFGFSMYQPPAFGIHPAMREVGPFEFMTGCSLEVSKTAQPIMVVPNQVRQDHDYAAGSFFGTIYSDPRMDHGPIALAAAGTYGQGRVLAFSDSTVLSSFALYLFDREKFLRDGVAFLNTQPAGGVPRSVLSLLGLLTMAAAAFSLRPFSGNARLSVLAFSPWLAVPAGILLATTQTAAAHPPLAAVRPVPRIALFTGGTDALYPPVLGSTGKLDLDTCFDTFFAAIPRSGVMPWLTQDFDAALQGNAFMALNPYLSIIPSAQTRLKNWVENGGTLIVGVRTDKMFLDPINSYLGQFDIRFSTHDDQYHIQGMSELPRLTPRQSIYGRDVGKGRVLLVTGTQWWSRERLGHAFSVPNADRRACYKTLAAILETHARIAPTERRTYAIFQENER